MVPGNFPLGCFAIYLTTYETKDKSQYDSAGCLKWLNEFSEFYNQKLQFEIQRLRGIHPHANIIYADYYNAALPLYHHPTKFGFTGLKSCCGKGGPYNYNASETCGKPGVLACDDPSKYISWDGLHLTEAAYGLIADVFKMSITITEVAFDFNIVKVFGLCKLSFELGFRSELRITRVPFPVTITTIM
ncbi:hypothetical protein TSUD_385470 [Trifolium subterraneum]|uniref:Sinapine esterase n=1 Tax=Trifolium subterraneum TaxID=3900 RepID=A0A2Z6PAT5_TRISU|nr:hypothetical protein TSUD_385470 [Trifolium subterraneum]